MPSKPNLIYIPLISVFLHLLCSATFQNTRISKDIMKNIEIQIPDTPKILKRGCKGSICRHKTHKRIRTREASAYFVGESMKQIDYYTHSFQLQKGEKILLDCQGNLRNLLQYHFPGARGTWYHNQKLFQPDNDRTSLTDTSDLHIASLLPIDNGVWTCEVRLDENSPLFTAAYTIAVEGDVPDMTVSAGEPFTLKCNSAGLSRFFNAKMATQWYHNTSLYRAFEDSKLEDVQEMKIEASKFSDSGVWLCRVAERDEALRRPPKEWVTNVVRLYVLQDEMLVKIQKFSAVAVIVIVVVVLLCLVLIIRKIKKRRAGDVSMEDSDESDEESEDTSAEDEELSYILKAIRKKGRNR